MLAFFAESKHSVLISTAALESPRHYGEAHFETRMIVVNPRRGNLFKVVETLVHEAIHLMQPEWKHGTVNRYERDVMQLLTGQEHQWIISRAMALATWRD